MSKLTIVNVGYRSTHYWVISNGRSRFLLDLGWPGSLPTLQANLKRMDVPLAEIRYGLATHYHSDHAGLAQDLKEQGLPLLVIDVQVNAIPQMKKWTNPEDNYRDITLHDNVVISCAESRALLATIDIPGEIVPTPGHSDDSVSLVLDNGAVFTGDLTHPNFVAEADAEVVRASWQRLKAKGAIDVYPAHGPTWPLERFVR